MYISASTQGTCSGTALFMRSTAPLAMRSAILMLSMRFGTTLVMGYKLHYPCGPGPTSSIAARESMRSAATLPLWSATTFRTVPVHTGCGLWDRAIDAFRDHISRRSAITLSMRSGTDHTSKVLHNLNMHSFRTTS